LLEQN